MSKVMVIGLDGATWDLLDIFIEEGALPNLQKLRENGSWGNLKSSFPARTMPAWKCFSTGKNPGKLNIFDFKYFDKDNKEFGFANLNKKDNLEIWDLLSNLNKKSIVINVPGTYPAKDINGIIITGMMTPSKKSAGFVNSKKILKLIPENYLIEPTGGEFYNKTNKEQISLIKQTMKQRFNLANNIAKSEDWDFFMFVVRGSDILQHLFWDQQEQIKEFWQELDEELGKTIHANNDCTFVLMSDHGFGPVKGEFNINEWLLDKGYLKIKKKGTIPAALNFMGLRRQTVYKMLAKVKLKSLARLIPWKIKKLVPDAAGASNISCAKIDWNKTKAISFNHNCIHLNTKQSRNNDELCQALIKDLSEYKENGINIKSYLSKEIYAGKKNSRWPDILFSVNDYAYKINTSLGRNKVFELPNTNSRIKGIHRENGIYVFWGPEIKKNYMFDANIIDLMPTISFILGIEPPKDIDGKIIQKIINFKAHKKKKHPTEQIKIKKMIKKMTI